MMSEVEIHLPAEMFEEKTSEDGKTYWKCTMRQIVLHTIGLDNTTPRIYHRHGKAYYKPYRNYFNTYVGSYPWTMLCEAGYAEMGTVRKINGKDMTDYWLTRKGLDWLGKELDVYIYDEED